MLRAAMPRCFPMPSRTGLVLFGRCLGQRIHKVTGLVRRALAHDIAAADRARQREPRDNVAVRARGARQFQTHLGKCVRVELIGVREFKGEREVA